MGGFEPVAVAAWFGTTTADPYVPPCERYDATMCREAMQQAAERRSDDR